MPSHIFTRVGYWKESIASNTASARAAKEGKDFDEQLHAMDYMVYAYLQLGAGPEGANVVAEMNGRQRLHRTVRFRSLCACRQSGALCGGTRRLEGRGGAAGAAEQVRLCRCDDAFRARAGRGPLRAIRTAAKADIAKLAELREKLREAKDAYWTEQVDIQWQIANAWVLYAEGKHDDALKAMSAAADAEDKTEKHPVTPGVPTPARELYGQMLLERGMAKEALAAFEATLEEGAAPSRRHARRGKAAENAGDAAKARQHYMAAVALAESADPVRPEIAEARAFVAKN